MYYSLFIIIINIYLNNTFDLKATIDFTYLIYYSTIFKTRYLRVVELYECSLFGSRPFYNNHQHRLSSSNSLSPEILVTETEIE